MPRIFRIRRGRVSLAIWEPVASHTRSVPHALPSSLASSSSSSCRRWAAPRSCRRGLGRRRIEPPEARVEILASADAVPNQYIVTLHDGVGAPAAVVADDLTEEHGGTLIQVYDHALQGFAVTMTDAEVLELAHDPAVASIQQDSIVETASTQTPSPSWGLDRVDQTNLPLDNSRRLRGHRRRRSRLRHRHRDQDQPHRLRWPRLDRHRPRGRRQERRRLRRPRHPRGRDDRWRDLRRRQGRIARGRPGAQLHRQRNVVERHRRDRLGHRQRHPPCGREPEPRHRCERRCWTTR